VRADRHTDACRRTYGQRQTGLIICPMLQATGMRQIKTYLFDKGDKRLNLHKVKLNSCSRDDAVNVVNDYSCFTSLQCTAHAAHYFNTNNYKPQNQ